MVHSRVQILCTGSLLEIFLLFSALISCFTVISGDLIERGLSNFECKQISQKIGNIRIRRKIIIVIMIPLKLIIIIVLIL